MATSNSLVASLLRRYAGTLGLEKANRFKIKAYRKAADTIDQLDRDVAELVKKGEPLTTLPGIGEGLSAVITEIIRTGRLALLDRSLASLSPELQELSSQPGLDPKKVLRIYKKLEIHSLDELRAALESGKIGELDRRTEFHIRQGLASRHFILLWEADKIAPSLINFLKSLASVKEVMAVGSLRRRQEIVGDLNFLVQTKRPATVFKQFQKFGSLKRLKSGDANTAEYELSSGVRVTLTAATAEEWGIAQIERTGSKAHVEQLMKYLADKKRAAKKFVAASNATEEQLYRLAGLSFIPPELREGGNEIEAAADGSLPMLIELKDLCGDLHMHTTASDGANTLEEMAEAARARGYQYIAITDHSQSLKIAGGLSESELLEQIKMIDRFNERSQDLTVLKSSEVDILEDGSLDYPNSILKHLDFTICSIHSRFALNKRQQTDRIRRAMDNRFFTILGHATGRLLLKREGYEIDVRQVLKQAAANQCFLEINSSPDRLDLSAEHAHLAKEFRIIIAVNTDSHSTRELRFMSAGINQARRAWLEASTVLNSLPLPTLLKQLRKRR